LNKWLFELSCGNSCFNFYDIFKYVNHMIIVLLVLNFHAWNVYLDLLCVCTKFMKNDVVIVDSWVTSWLFVVDVVMWCVVDELMPWVFIIMVWWCELGCCWEFWWNFVLLLIYVEMMFWFQVLCNFECLFMYIYLYTTFGTSLDIWEIKIWVFGRKMVQTPEEIVQNWWLYA